MHLPRFSVRRLNLGCRAIDDGEATVAIVTPQGCIDWLLTDEHGPRLESIVNPTHLGNVLGLKFNLDLPHLTNIDSAGIRIEPIDGGARLRVSADSSAKGFAGRTEAVLSVDPDTSRYRWELTTRLTCQAAHPGRWIEYNNVLPAECGRCFLAAAGKRFSHTVIRDRDGTAWLFPHQHRLHYGDNGKFRSLNHATPALAGFIGEELEPFVTVHAAPGEPDWAICDMFFDLHCGTRHEQPFQAGETLEWRYAFHWLSRHEREALLPETRPVPISADDWRRHQGPRLALGRNRLGEAVRIDEPDEASCFNPRPPELVWDRTGGPDGGALRLEGDGGTLVWQALPPSLPPPDRRLRLKALVRTEGVTGRGLTIQAKVTRWEWQPVPRPAIGETVISRPVDGSSDGWVTVATPELVFEPGDRDSCVWIEIVLEGAGRAWVADIAVELEGSAVPAMSPA